MSECAICDEPKDPKDEEIERLQAALREIIEAPCDTEMIAIGIKRGGWRKPEGYEPKDPKDAEIERLRGALKEIIEAPGDTEMIAIARKALRET